MESLCTYARSGLLPHQGLAILFSFYNYMCGTFQATVGFQESDFFQKAIKMVLRCILNVILHLSGFKLSPSSTNVNGIKNIFICHCFVCIVGIVHVDVEWRGKVRGRIGGFRTFLS